MSEPKDRQLMSDRELLIRLDERMEASQRDIEKIHKRLESGSSDINCLKSDVKMLKDRWNMMKWLGGIGGATGLSGFGLWVKSFFGG